MIQELLGKKAEGQRKPHPKVEIVCGLCGNKFLIHYYRTRISKKSFCSKSCFSLWKSSWAKSFHLGISNKGKKASESTIIKMRLRKGEKCNNWRGGRHVDEKGYVVVYAPGHPSKKYENYVYEHRLKMEQSLGRFLSKEEVVHHIDGNRQNNDINNLMLFKSHSDHKRHHIALVKEETMSVRA